MSCSDHLAPWWTDGTAPTNTKEVIAPADPSQHVKRIKLAQNLGATIMVLMNVSGRDPHGALRVYGERVLPGLRR